MASVTLEIAELKDLNEQLNNLRTELAGIRSGARLTREWYSGREACALKGVPYESLRKAENRHLLPNFGRPTAVLQWGKCRQMYHRDQVALWLTQTQEEIEAAWARELRKQAVR